jgi:tRNA(Ile)-lysidine synthase
VSAVSLVATLEQFLARLPDGGRAAIVVAFSGGGDSTALLWALRQLNHSTVAAHFDHALDTGSADRAEAARLLADCLGAAFVTERRQGSLPPGQSLEAVARHLRYEFLDRLRQRTGARWIATAHHQSDQAETVVLRCLFGSGLRGLSGIAPGIGAVIRPFLKVRREVLQEAVREAGLLAVEDPTNLDCRRPRNLVRASVLALLASESACSPAMLVEQLAGVAEMTRRAFETIDRRLAVRLRLHALSPRSAAVDLAAFTALPNALVPIVLAALHRQAGAHYPPPASAQEELRRQLVRGNGVGCDAGALWRWETEGRNLRLVPRVPPPPGTQFSCKLEAPGEVLIPELGLWVRLSRRPVEPWMLRGEPHRAGFALSLAEGASVTIRNRLPGDRLHPLGAKGSRRLKEILIDRRVPSSMRDRLPLLCVGGQIAWVPGVTIDERYRLRDEEVAWVAELEPADAAEERESTRDGVGFVEER